MDAELIPALESSQQNLQDEILRITGGPEPSLHQRSHAS